MHTNRYIHSIALLSTKVIYYITPNPAKPLIVPWLVWHNILQRFYIYSIHICMIMNNLTSPFSYIHPMPTL